MTTCPMFHDDCRFLSEEHLLVPYTKLERNPKTNRLEPTGNYMDKVLLGAYCNNVGGWVKDLKVCPARWGLRGVATVGVVADGCGTYSTLPSFPVEPDSPIEKGSVPIENFNV